jgi:hypothetical protein
MLRIGCARDVEQDLAAFEQMGDGFLEFRHRINRGDRNAQRTGGDKRSGFDLCWEDLRHMIEIAQEETFHCQVPADQEKGVNRQRLSAGRCVGDEHAAVRQQLNKLCRRITAPPNRKRQLFFAL